MKILFTLLLFTAGLFAQTLNVPRPEYPRPQFERSDWINLNGEWTYSFDFGNSGRDKNWMNKEKFDDKIIVPFCPESKLSGVGYKDFIEHMWYQRTLNIPENWKGKNIILNFGAVDYESEVFIDGKSVGIHFGGTSSFGYDISRYVTPGKTHNLVIRIADDNRKGEQPSGKQCYAFNSEGCFYTRTTGIWQTVWLEAVNYCGLKDCYIVPDLDNNQFNFNPRFFNIKKGLKLRITLSNGQEKVAQSIVAVSSGNMVNIPVENPITWSPENPFLYNILMEVLDEVGNVLDKVNSYAGMRKVHIEGNKIYLNNKPYYLRFVLDQGFYQDGIWTAPSDDALKRDIELSMKAGFNGARLHQKVFEERFHYWADKLGYLTWGESSSWGCNTNKIEAARNFISEWEEIIVRDRNHPSIIAWTPFNETWERSGSDGKQHNRFLTDIYKLTHNLDFTRPVHDVSGNYHVKTDIWTVHLYDQDPNKLKEQLTIDPEKGVYRNNPKYEAEYSGQPYLVDEYGGIKWITGNAFAENSWGYGDGPKTKNEFYNRLESLTNVILNFDHIVGYCYTQLTDIEQEQNGIYNYDRSEKFDMSKIKSIFSRSKEIK